MPYLVGYITPQDYGATGNGTTDDTAAINAALAAVSTNGSTVLFPAGSYRITSTLAPSVMGTVIEGTGQGSQILYDGSVATTAIAPTGNIRLFMRDIRISQSNASHLGTAVDLSGANTSTLERVLIDGGGASGVSPLVGVKMNASTCHYNVVRDCRIGYGGASSTGIYIAGAAHSNVVDNTRCLPQSDDVNSSGIYITNAHSTTLVRPDVESAAGNGIWLDTGANATEVYNAYCDTNNINLKITSGVIAPTITGSTLQGGVTANIQDNGSVSPSIVNAWPNSGSNSYSSVALTNVAGYSLNGIQVPGNVFHASDMNLLAWAYDPALPTNSLALSTGGVVHLIKVILRYGGTINNVLYQVNTAGSGLTTGENFVGVYDSTGTRRAVSADQTTAWASTGLMTTAMTASYAAPAGVYYIAFVVNGTTGPALARLNGLAGAGATINAGLTAANYRFATNGTGNTSLPASLTLSSNSTESVPYWAALS